jgi:hypothetical protein
MSSRKRESGVRDMACSTKGKMDAGVLGSASLRAGMKKLQANKWRKQMAKTDG